MDELRIAVFAAWLAKIRQDTKGGRALISCAVQAMHLAAAGQEWTLSDLAQSYAEYVRSNSAAVLRNMYNECGRGGCCTARLFLDMAVDLWRVHGEG